MKAMMNPQTGTHSQSLAFKHSPTTTYSQSLTCNNLTCITNLSCVPVWVTVCGHIFCDRCGTNCSTNMTCIKCKDTLGQRSIVRKKSLNPGLEWKRLILTGLTPDIVMETCAYAIQFYQNQTSEEVNRLEEKVRSMKGGVETAKEYYEGVIEQFKMEISTLEARLASKSSSSSSSFYSAQSTEESGRLDMIVGRGSDKTFMEDGRCEWIGTGMGENSLEFDEAKESNVFDVSEKSSPSFLNFCPKLDSFEVKETENSRPLKLVRTEITEQNRVNVNGENVVTMERSSVFDNEKNVKTVTRSAQSSYDQIPLLLDRLAGKTKSSFKSDMRYGGNSKQGVPYSKKML